MKLFSRRNYSMTAPNEIKNTSVQPHASRRDERLRLAARCHGLAFSFPSPPVHSSLHRSVLLIEIRLPHERSRARDVVRQLCTRALRKRGPLRQLRPIATKRWITLSLVGQRRASNLYYSTDPVEFWCRVVWNGQDQAGCRGGQRRSLMRQRRFNCSKRVQDTHHIYQK